MPRPDTGVCERFFFDGPGRLPNIWEIVATLAPSEIKSTAALLL